MPLSAPLWSVGASLAAPVLRLMLRWRVHRGKEDPKRLAERLGRETMPRPPGRLLWLHAASVGESLSALPLIAALPPGLFTLLTTGTLTSATLVATRLRELGLDDRVAHRFVPLDVPSWAARFLDHWRPDAACFMESELWPNLLSACRRRGIGLALVNARLSPRSAAGWRRLPGLARTVLSGFAFVAARSEADADRLRRLGAGTVQCWGDLKAADTELPADPVALARLRQLLGDAPRWLAASTHVADDAIVAEAHRRLSARHPGLLTIVVPRHPERGASLAARFSAPRRSLGDGPSAGGGVWVADTLGELGLFYRCCPIVLIGKSFGGGGGQNPWEPARLGCAIACGPDMHNFDEATRTLTGCGALRLVADAAALAAWVDAMLSDPAARRGMAEAGPAAPPSARTLAPRLAARLAAMAGA